MSDHAAGMSLGRGARLAGLSRLWPRLRAQTARERLAAPGAEGAGGAAPAEQSGWLVRFSKQILHGAVNVAFVSFVLVMGFSGWQLWSQRLDVIIDPISVPAALAANGYTSELATRNLRDYIAYLQNKANTKYGKKQCMQDSQTDWDADVKTIDLPGTGLSVHDIVDLLGAIIPWLQPPRITGEYFLSNNRLVLELWLGTNNIYAQTASAPGIGQAEINELIKGIDTKTINTETQESELGAAFAIIRNTQPYVAASDLDSWGDESNARAILDDIIRNAPPNDRDIPYTHNLLGYIDIKNRDYGAAKSELEQAPKLGIAHSNLCYIYFDQTNNSYDTAKAQTECKNAIVLDQRLLKPHELLGQYYAQLVLSSPDAAAARQNSEQAIGQFQTVEQVIDHDPESRLSTQSDLAAAYDGLSIVYVNRSLRDASQKAQKSDLDQAEKEYEQAVNLNPSTPVPPGLRSNLQAASGR